jgi:hypothetical protein
MSTPIRSSKLAGFSWSKTAMHLSSAVPPPVTMPSSMAARVALSASVTRS